MTPIIIIHGLLIYVSTDKVHFLGLYLSDTVCVSQPFGVQVPLEDKKFILLFLSQFFSPSNTSY